MSVGHMRFEEGQQPPRGIEPSLVNSGDAARLLGVSRAHFYRMLKSGRAPGPVRLGGAVRWRLNELRAWADAGMPPLNRWRAMQGVSDDR